MSLFLLLQLSVQASDQALPTDRTEVVQVIVSVPRDNAPPQFDITTETVDVGENAAVGSKVVTLRARDDNLQGEMRYEVTGVYPAQSFFEIRNNGDLVIRQPLTSDSLQLSEYTVTVR